MFQGDSTEILSCYLAVTIRDLSCTVTVHNRSKNVSLCGLLDAFIMAQSSIQKVNFSLPRTGHRVVTVFTQMPGNSNLTPQKTQLPNKNVLIQI